MIENQLLVEELVIDEFEKAGVQKVPFRTLPWTAWRRLHFEASRPVEAEGSPVDDGFVTGDFKDEAQKLPILVTDVSVTMGRPIVEVFNTEDFDEQAQKVLSPASNSVEGVDPLDPRQRAETEGLPR